MPDGVTVSPRRACAIASRPIDARHRRHRKNRHRTRRLRAMRSRYSSAPSPMNNDGPRPHPEPAIENGDRVSHRCALDFDQTRQAEWRLVRDVEQRGEHLVPIAVHPDAYPIACRQMSDSPRDRAPSAPTRPTIGRRVTSANPCIVAIPIRRPVNDPGPTRDGEAIDRGQRDSSCARAAPGCRPAAVRHACARARQMLPPRPPRDRPRARSRRCPGVLSCRAQARASANSTSLPQRMAAEARRPKGATENRPWTKL